MADSKLNTAAIGKLLEQARELHEKQAAIIDEIDAHLGGRATIGKELKAAEQAYTDAWAGRYRTGGYVWRYTTDRPHMKRLIKTLGTEELVARFARYLGSSEEFATRSRHSFSMFVATVNQWAAPAEFALDGGVPDCKHVPPCTSDQQHTKRKTAEMRA